MLCNGVLNGSITQNCFPEEIKSAYIEHRKEDIVHYRDKYCSRLYSLTLELSKKSVVDRANVLVEIEKLTNMISKIDNMSDEDILNREYEKL